MTISLETEDRQELIATLQHVPELKDGRSRQQVLENAGLQKLIPRINFSGSTYTVISEIIIYLERYGRISEDCEALGVFLNAMKDFVGIEQQGFLERLLTKYDMMTPIGNVADDRSSRKTPLPPLDVPTFTGRDAELKQLEAQLIHRQGEKVCSIVGLTGSGGIGKSALAYHFAKNAFEAGHFPDGVIGLRVDDKDIDAVAREFARRCGETIDPEDDRDAATLMQEIFGHRRMLLIFDNADNARIKALRPGGDRCAVIVTTRNRDLPSSLDVPGEGILDLPPLPNSDSLKLLKQILGDDRINDELDAAYKIIKLVGNLPLALQIVGAALKTRRRSLVDYAASLEAEQNRLKRLQVRGDDDLNVKASFNLSLKLLEASEIDFFACLSVCAKDEFSRQTAMVTADSEDEWTAQDDLDRLYQLSLLNYVERSENRFVLHPLIRLFAKQLAEERSLLEAAAKRHAQFFIEFVKSSQADSSIASQMGEDIDDILLAGRWLQQQEIVDRDFTESIHGFFEEYGYWEQATRLMESFQGFAQRSQDWESVVIFGTRQAKYLALREELVEAEDVLQSIRNIPEKIEPQTARQNSQVRWLIRWGSVLQKQSRFDEAIEQLYEAETIAEELDDRVALRNVLDTVQRTLRRQGNYEEALPVLQQIKELNKALGDLSSQTFGLNCLGGVLQQLGRLDEAVVAFQEQIEIAKALKDSFSIAIRIISLGGIFQQQRDLDKAVNIFLRVSHFYTALKNSDSLVGSLRSLQSELKQHEKFEEAHKIIQLWIQVAKYFQDRRSLVIGLHCLGGVLEKLRRFEEAVAAFQEEIEIAKALGDQRQQAIGLNCLGGVLQQLGSFEEAVAAFQEEIEIAKALDDLNSQVIGLNRLGGVFQQLGRFDEAVVAFQDCKNIYEDLDESQSLAIVLHTIGQLLKRQRKWPQAEQILRQSYDLCVKLKDDKGQAMLLNTLGQVLQKQNGDEKFKQALMHFRASIKLGQALNDPKHLAQVHTAMGQAFLKRGRDQEALVELRHAFTHDVGLNNEEGLKIILPNLTYALVKLNRRNEALEYCDISLKGNPDNLYFLSFRNRLVKRRAFKSGIIKTLKNNQKYGFRYGFIRSHDGSSDIYFREGFVEVDGLMRGTQVDVEIRENPKGLYANNLWILPS